MLIKSPNSFEDKPLHLCFVGNMLGRNDGFITTQGEILADLFSAEGYKITCVSSKINRVMRLLEIIITLIKGYKNFDLVILDTYSGLSFIIADVVGFLCRLFGLPLIMVLHGGNLPNFIKKYPNWAKRVLTRGDILVAPSQFLADKIGDFGFKIPVITNVLELENYPYQKRSKILPNLIWMRSFHPIYNPEMAVSVLAKLRESVPEARLTMAGTDKGLEPKIKSLAKDLGVSDAIRFAGFLNLEEKIKEFSKADIYLNTNLIDNMPVSVMEARALGLPVIATNVGGLPYLIENGKNGFLVPSEDVESMVESIKILLNDSALTEKISAAGRSLAENSAWTRVRLRWENLFSEILKTRSVKTVDSTNLGDSLNAEK